MKIEQRKVGETQIFELHGRMALGDGDTELVRAVEGCLEQGCRKVVLDLTDVPWMDSSGLGHTVKCKGLAVQKKAAIAIVVPRETRIPMIVQVCLQLAYAKAFENEITAVESLGT